MTSRLQADCTTAAGPQTKMFQWQSLSWRTTAISKAAGIATKCRGVVSEPRRRLEKATGTLTLRAVRRTLSAASCLICRRLRAERTGSRSSRSYSVLIWLAPASRLSSRPAAMVCSDSWTSLGTRRMSWGCRILGRSAWTSEF